MYAAKSISPAPRSKVSTFGPTSGQTEIQLPQVLDATQATLIQNYFIEMEGEGKMDRRGGTKSLANVASTETPKIFRKWTNTFYVLGYGTTLAAFNKNDNTINTIKSDFTANLTDGKRLGLDFYSCNGRLGDKIFKTTLPTMAYTGQTTNFTVGQVVTDAVTGGTATIIADSDSGATGTLTLDNINGTFGANAISDPLGGDGTGSAVTYTNTAEISAGGGTVPKCEALHVFDKRLVAVSTDTSESAVHAADQNDTTEWDTSSTAAGQSFTLDWPFAGAAVSAANLQSTNTGLQSQGNVMVVFYKDGYAGFKTDVTNVGGTYAQDTPTAFEKINDGGERGALSTPIGILFGNENGAFLLQSDGNRIELTKNMSRSRLSNLDTTDQDFAWLPRNNRLLWTVKESAMTNNKIFWFEILGSNVIFGELAGLSLNRFLLDGDILYAASATSPRVIQMFPPNVHDDQGSDVFYKYRQPINFGQIETIKDILRVDAGAFLAAGTALAIKIFGVDEDGNEVEAISYTFTGTGASGSFDGMGEASWGEEGFDSIEALGGTRFQEAKGENKKAYGYKRYILEISGNDALPHTIAYVSTQGVERRLQRQVLLT